VRVRAPKQTRALHEQNRKGAVQALTALFGRNKLGSKIEGGKAHIVSTLIWMDIVLRVSDRTQRYVIPLSTALAPDCLTLLFCKWKCRLRLQAETLVYFSFTVFMGRNGTFRYCQVYVDLLSALPVAQTGMSIALVKLKAHLSVQVSLDLCRS